MYVKIVLIPMSKLQIIFGKCGKFAKSFYFCAKIRPQNLNYIT